MNKGNNQINKKERSPWAWIPSLYFAEGIPYIIVMFVASDMYKTLGVSNSSLAFWTSIIYLPWVIKAFWSPFVDIFSTRRKWIFWMQIILAISFAGVSLALHLPWWFPVTIMFLWLMAFVSATHDIAADGFYILALTEKKQAFFTGIRSTFYRLAMIVGLGLLVIITGLILDNTGLESQKLSIQAVPNTEFNGETIFKEIEEYKNNSTERLEEPEIKVIPENIEVPLYNPESGLDSAIIYFVLTAPPVDDEIIKMTFGQKSGSKDIYLSGKSVFEFDKTNWDKPQMTTIKVKHNLKKNAEARFDAKAGNVPLAWSISISALALLFLILALYHRFVLPYPASDVSAAKEKKGSYGKILLSFFKIEGIVPAIFFILLYRFSESQLTKMASPFLLDTREAGGLAMSLTEKGFAYGTVGVISLLTGGILGGVLAARHGLKKWIWWMAIAINLPNIVYIFMSYALPENLVTINMMVAIEQFGYGFGFTGYMLYMLYLVSKSKYKTAHFAIATGFMAAGMMFPGMISGWVQEVLGYQHFFIYVIICTIPSFIALWFINRKLDPEFGIRNEKENYKNKIIYFKNNIMKKAKVSVIMHFQEEATYGNDGFLRSVKSIFKQTSKNVELVIIGGDSELSKKVSKLNTAKVSVQFIKPQATFGGSLNSAFKAADSQYIMCVDNRTAEITIKQAAVDTCLLTMNQEKNCGLIYSDYEIIENSQMKEVRLLKHHIGRVRDNQDYGKAFFLKKEAIETVGFCDESIEFNTLYDLRLKISEKYEMVHIANRYAGSLYAVKAEGKSHNVFDYLLASKESQLEAEKVLESHLRRIGANLETGQHYGPRPTAPKEAKLKASVIIPVNNRPKFTGMAIDSIQAQTVQDVEAIIVVNGGENDPTVEAVKRYLPGGDKYDSNKPSVQLLVYDINNLGLCLNIGAWHAKGEYYVQLDSDDRLKPDAVEKILAVYDEDPKIGMVIGSYEVWEMKEKGELSRMKDLPVVTHDEWTEENGRNNLLRIGGAGAPRSLPIQLIRDIGFSVNQEPYSRNYGEDYGMVLKISEKHRIGRVWDAIYEVIRHSGGTDHSIDQATIDRNDEAKDFLRKETILRRIKLNQKNK